MHAPRHTLRPARSGVTIIEVLVTLGILVVLFTIATPIILQGRFAAKQTRCLSNMRQVLVGVNAFSASNASRLPENRVLESSSEYITWRRLLMDQQYVDDATIWSCPLHPEPGPRSEVGYETGGARCVGDVVSSYALNGHLLWRRDQRDEQARISDAVIDRPSHTILVAETNRAFCHLRVSPPIVANYFGDNPGPYSYWHDGKGVYGFQDGHVEILGFLETGNPDCRWHNRQDLTPDPFVPQTTEERKPHGHPDWKFLVPEIYRR
ncbi:MAG: prepilin-type N-terminal cleavage/methylation domain-containing protein [Planctomycetota bacterium]